MVMDKTMIKAATTALRAGAKVIFRNRGSFSNRATKPKVVVTPVEMRHSSRHTPYTTVSQPMPISRHTVRVGMTVPPSTEV